MPATVPPQHTLPTGRIMAMLLGVAVLMWMGLRVVMPRLFAPDAVHATDVAALAAGGGALVGLLPVSAMARGGVMPTVWGYFMGAAGRALVALVALVVARQRGIHVEPMAVAMMTIYLPLLAIEAGYVGYYLWRLDGPQDHRADHPAITAGPMAAKPMAAKPIAAKPVTMQGSA